METNQILCMKIGVNFVISDYLKKKVILYFSHETLLLSYAAVADVTGEYFNKDSKLYLLSFSYTCNIYKTYTLQP